MPVVGQVFDLIIRYVFSQVRDLTYPKPSRCHIFR
jgi:hypothetical protein